MDRREDNKSPGNSEEEATTEKEALSRNSSSKPPSFSGRQSRALSTLPKSVVSSYFVILKNFYMSQTELRRLIGIVSEGVNANARKRDEEGQPLRWCFVPTLPTVKVTGKCLALDFGCSNHYIRASLFHMSGMETADHRTFLLTPAIRSSEMQYFCDYVAMCLKAMLLDNNIDFSDTEATIFMGVVVGFDVKVKAQRYPASAFVLNCSKDYKMHGFIGHDIVPQFHEAFKRAGLSIQINAVINDTVGILLSAIHELSRQSQYQASSNQPDCSISVLCHCNGANMAYLENDREFLDNILSGEHYVLRQPQGRGQCVIVNSEVGYSIGANGELNSVVNTIESHVRESLNTPLRLECIISGAWYPHLLKRTMYLLTATKTIKFPLGENWTIDNSKCFEIFNICDRWQTGAHTSDTQLATELRALLEIRELNPTCAGAIAESCNAIVGRTAEVTAAGIIAIANRIYGRAYPSKLAIAYGGSLFATLGQLKELLQSALNSLVPSSTEVTLIYSEVAFGCAVTAISSIKQ